LTPPIKADILHCGTEGRYFKQPSANSCGSLAMFTAMLRASSLLSNLAADYRRTSKAISIMHKSWKPSRRDESSLYRLVGDFVSEGLLVSPVKVLVAIVH
jgi:hypothetical protein